MITRPQARFGQSQILTSIMLGIGQGNYIAEKILPSVPSKIGSLLLGKRGKEALRRYNLKTAPGSAIKRIDLDITSVTYTVENYKVDIPIPDELMEVAEGMRVLGANLQYDQIAMQTAMDVLNLDREVQTAELVTNPANLAVGNSLALAGGTRWSTATGTPVRDVRAAAQVVRKATGKKPTGLMLSATSLDAILNNAEMRGYMPNNVRGTPLMPDLLAAFMVDEIVVGDSIYVDGNDQAQDVWGNTALLFNRTNVAGGGGMSLTQPAFGFTHTDEKQMYAKNPRHDDDTDSWIYGAVYKRQPVLTMNTAGFLFTGVV
jgi:hypothetical protein